jgi:hypothetical protein
VGEALAQSTAKELAPQSLWQMGAAPSGVMTAPSASTSDPLGTSHEVRADET